MAELSEEQQRLEQIRKLLADPTKNDSDNSDDDEVENAKELVLENAKLSHTIHLLYSASKIRLYKIAEKLETCRISSEEMVSDVEVQLPIPEAEEWNFKLGDKVRIKYPLKDFKSIQERTLGWNAKLRSIYDCVGIVTQHNSVYDNAVTVYTPARFSNSSLYAGVLKKVQQSEDDDPVPSKWKIDDYVTTKMDIKVVQLLQKALDEIPTKYLGRKGRVVAVTRIAIVVTFDEKKSFHINSYLLMRCPDQSPIEFKRVEHEKGFKIGETVRVIPHFKILIKNQKEKGGWAEEMSEIAGQEVKIIDIQKDGALDIQKGTGRSWRISHESVMKLHESNIKTEERDVELLPGEVVKIKIVQNIRTLLESRNVALCFLEHLRLTADLKLIDDDLDYLIRYNCDQNVSAFSTTLKKVSNDEAEKYRMIQKKIEEIAVGCEVYLDIGPPSYVSAALKEVQCSDEVIRAMTRPATLIGYAEDNRAVIKYKDGSRYKIKKKFLTVPERFNISDIDEGLDFDIAKDIQEAVANSVQIIHTEDRGGAEDQPSTVKILSMVFGSPSTIDLRVVSMAATTEKICECLMIISDWQVEFLCDGTFYLSDLKSSVKELKVGLYFNDDDYPPKILEPDPKQRDDDESNVKKEGIIMHENVAAPAAALPFGNDLAMPHIHRCHPVPEVVGIEEFNYFRLFDASHTRSIYLPYVTRGEGIVVGDVGQHEERSGAASIMNIYNINKVNRISN